MLVIKKYLFLGILEKKNVGLILQTWLPTESKLSLQLCPRKKTQKDLAWVKKYAFKYGSPIKLPVFQSLLATEKNKEEK